MVMLPAASYTAFPVTCTAHVDAPAARAAAKIGASGNLAGAHAAVRRPGARTTEEFWHAQPDGYLDSSMPAKVSERDPNSRAWARRHGCSLLLQQ